MKPIGERVVEGGCGTELKIFRRNVYDPRALAQILERAEAHLAEIKHPDPVIRKFYDFSLWLHKLNWEPAPSAPGGTKWLVFFVVPAMNSADNNCTGNETFQYVIVR